MSGDPISLGASACCCPLGSWLYSSPQWRATTTTSAPRRRATLGVGEDPALVDGVGSPRLAAGGRDAVEAERVREQRQPDPVDVEQRRRAGLLWGSGGPGVADPGRVERVERPSHALGAPVVCVVGRRRAGVVAGGRQRRGDLRWHGEAGIARERPAGRSDRRLHVTDRHVGPAHHRPDAGEHGPEVVAAGVSRRGGVGARLLPQGRVEQDVAGRDQREPARGHGRARRRGPCRRRIADGACGLVRLDATTWAAEAGEQHGEQPGTHRDGQTATARRGGLLPRAAVPTGIMTRPGEPRTCSLGSGNSPVPTRSTARAAPRRRARVGRRTGVDRGRRRPDRGLADRADDPARHGPYAASQAPILDDALDLAERLVEPPMRARLTATSAGEPAGCPAPPPSTCRGRAGLICRKSISTPGFSRPSGRGPAWPLAAPLRRGRGAGDVGPAADPPDRMVMGDRAAGGEDRLGGRLLQLRPLLLLATLTAHARRTCSTAPARPV